MIQFLVESAHVVKDFSSFLPFLVVLNKVLVFAELRATGTGPRTGETLALLTFVSCALFGNAVVLFEGVLTEAFEVVSPVGRDVVEASTLAFWSFAWDLFALGT